MVHIIWPNPNPSYPDYLTKSVSESLSGSQETMTMPRNLLSSQLFRARRIICYISTIIFLFFQWGTKFFYLKIISSIFFTSISFPSISHSYVNQTIQQYVYISSAKIIDLIKPNNSISCTTACLINFPIRFNNIDHFSNRKNNLGLNHFL